MSEALIITDADAPAPDLASALKEQGFAVVPGPVSGPAFERLARAYDTAVASAARSEVRVGSTTTRVNDFVNRGPEFDGIYVFPPLLAAARFIIGGPFKLSALHARTLRPGVPAQKLHVDVPRGSADWPLAGFILMIDAFHADNGATRFVPGSHRWTTMPEEALEDPGATHPGEVLACGTAGSLLIFNGSVWHGYSAHASDAPRRSLQGAFIPRTGRAATDFGARMSAETRSRLGAPAREVLAL